MYLGHSVVAFNYFLVMISKSESFQYSADSGHAAPDNDLCIYRLLQWGNLVKRRGEQEKPCLLPWIGAPVKACSLPLTRNQSMKLSTWSVEVRTWRLTLASTHLHSVKWVGFSLQVHLGNSVLDSLQPNTPARKTDLFGPFISSN